MPPVQQVFSEAQQLRSHPRRDREGPVTMLSYSPSYSFVLEMYLRELDYIFCYFDHVFSVAHRQSAQASTGVRVLVTWILQATWLMLKWTGAKSGLLSFLDIFMRSVTPF